MSPNKSLTVTLAIYSDNKPSVAWAQKAQGVFPQGIGRNTSIEKRSVLRLIDALSEEFRVLRSLGSAVSYRILHCSGPDNTAADRLSRYLEQCCDDAGKVMLAAALQDLTAVDLDGTGGLTEATKKADRLAQDEAYLLQLADFDPDPGEDGDTEADEVCFVPFKPRYPRRKTTARQQVPDDAAAKYTQAMEDKQQAAIHQLSSSGLQLQDVLVVVRDAQAGVVFSGRGTAYVFDAKDEIWSHCDPQCGSTSRF
ncbi:hypothetical protein Pmar_PMAR027345 [Perkinsus marinus ATCC 50983]|uniref:Uncharacterized protein n=1 Tax=Perkinsus marinus (strain ATCC 50983 / TXsc) TaxID=423536 RepID=C5L9R8_PERM5|nr:hypothetical protein Pmar_PMAR027345 [Perkinsus marinus ATCC 50983]EER06527.1 hypothetical protein Pmar_PMAR027345 [Perkinsus marinus ATCC 50983]|eukprot:XP_002774711.1 hypothetical protein Pmar_PMAR027345 [Perkinsus marinus ATCC 50983]